MGCFVASFKSRGALGKAAWECRARNKNHAGVEVGVVFGVTHLQIINNNSVI
jgi:hypothetical protein